VKPISVLRWAAWSPGIESPDDWRAWTSSPRALESDGEPDVRFVPALLRRRCDPLGRMMLKVVHDACPAEQRASVPTVFASRHGSFETRAGMLYTLARGEAVSPARFSHSVHNAQSGLFSIWAGNRAPSTSLSAGEDTFAHGLLETVAQVERGGGAPVLYVVGDSVIPPELRWLAEQKPGSYALALLLAGGVHAPGASGDGSPGCIEMAIEPGRGEPETDLPDALRFLAWWLSGRESLRIDHGALGWVWRREAG